VLTWKVLSHREGGCQEIGDRLDKRGASVETAAAQLPQDEEIFSMPSKDYLMLRSARRARLEARTAILQLFFRGVEQFPDTREAGAYGGDRSRPPPGRQGRGEPD
jgi:hypothetical protein